MNPFRRTCRRRQSKGCLQAMSRDRAIQQMIEAAKVMYHASGDSREWHQAHDALMYAVEEIQEIDAQPKSPPQAPQAFYFGCIKTAGHYLWDSSGRRRCGYTSDLPRDFPVMIGVLDAGLLGHYVEDQPEGEAVLSHIGNWTILSFWDRSVDRRHGCNSNFIIRGKWTFDEAVAVAKDQFANVWSRFTFEVSERTGQ